VAMPPRIRAGGGPRRPLSGGASPAVARSTHCRRPQPLSGAVPHAKQATCLARPRLSCRPPRGGAPHPSEAGAASPAWEGLGPAGFPGRLVRVVGLRRHGKAPITGPGQSKPPPTIEACFTTDLTVSAAEIVRASGHRWAVESAIRDRNAFDGLGQDQCRQRQRIIGANTVRLVLAAARPLWFIAPVERGTEGPLGRYRPWYRQKVAPSQRDVAEACQEALHEAGIFPLPWFIPELAANQEELDNVLPLAA
jgi:hypothetical protein